MYTNFLSSSTTFINGLLLRVLVLSLSHVSNSVTSKSISDIILKSRECEDSLHLLINSFPLICKEDWTTIKLILNDGFPRDISQQICETYCLNPLKTSLDTCPEIESIYDYVIGLCSRNNRDESCHEVFLAYNQSFPPTACPNHTQNNSCPLECTQELNNTSQTFECCFSMLNNTAYGDKNITGPYGYDYWTQCGVSVPENCEFSYSTARGKRNSVAGHSNLVSTMLSLLLLLISLGIIN